MKQTNTSKTPSKTVTMVTRRFSVWEPLNEFLTDKENAVVSPLLKENKIHFAGKYKTDIFPEVLFTGKHLGNIALNEEYKLHVENTLQQFLKSQRPEIESDK